MFIGRRTFVKGAAVTGAAAVAPQVLVRTARGQDKNKVLFVSEESNPKAIAVYDKINADFKKETGIEVVMEYPGFANIAKRVATLIAAGTPPEIVWYGAGQAMNLALENQLADKGDDRSIPTSQQFTYGWYRKDLYAAKKLDAPKSWDDYLKAVKALTDAPN